MGPRFIDVQALLYATLTVVLLGAFSAACSDQTATDQSSAESTSSKGVWEPVNYSEDIKLHSVHFISADEGWVSGAEGTILHTTDAGANWEVQLGRPGTGLTDDVTMLRFVDSTHGFAALGRKLLRTTDGQSWEEAGRLGGEFGPFKDMAFFSPQVGLQIVTTASHIARTTDGGRTWEKTLPECKAEMVVEGDTKEVTCELSRIEIVSPQVAFATAGGTGTFFLWKTADAGATWELITSSSDHAHEDESYFEQYPAFLDQQKGFLVMPRNHKHLMTLDGGQTWRAIISQAEGPLKFADEKVGWAVSGTKVVYTVDGGQTWLPVETSWPGYGNDFSFGGPGRVYVVGEHGMILRYTIVPETYESPDMVEAPAMGAARKP